MKIGILTYHRSNNYGALLQAIAHMNSERISQLQKLLGISESKFPVGFIAIGNLKWSLW
jgi:hypothetical protein